MFLQFSIRISILFIIQIILVFGSSLGDVALHKCPKFAKLREHRRDCVNRWAERIEEHCIYPGQKTSCYNDINSYVQKNTTKECLPYEAAGKICSSQMYVDEKETREKIVANICCVFTDCLYKCYGQNFRKPRGITRGDYLLVGTVRLIKKDSSEGEQEYDD
uniref:Uncharacterized protein n=1 Tax=Acrobeloides nanus TaxID=290746 RepID=A0A914C1Y6_9BILA